METAAWLDMTPLVVDRRPVDLVWLSNKCSSFFKVVLSSAVVVMNWLLNVLSCLCHFTVVANLWFHCDETSFISIIVEGAHYFTLTIKLSEHHKSSIVASLICFIRFCHESSFLWDLYPAVRALPEESSPSRSHVKNDDCFYNQCFQWSTVTSLVYLSM